MKGEVTICIPTRCVWDGICLTIESIRKRTVGTPFRILVCDNSGAANARACEPARDMAGLTDDGTRTEYLRRLASQGDIELIEVFDMERRYGHGENVARMLAQVQTPLAMLFNSTSEIVRGDWLAVLADMIRDPETDLGVARERAGGPREDDFITPVYWPNMMMISVPLYRRVFPSNDWSLDVIPVDEFQPADAPWLRERSPRRRLVFADTGWKFHRDVRASHARMLPLPDLYWNTYIQWLGGIDRNSHRPRHPFVVQTLAEINRRLAVLRSQK